MCGYAKMYSSGSTSQTSLATLKREGLDTARVIRVPSVGPAPQRLTRNGLKLKNRESRAAKRKIFTGAPKLGKRSSLRLNKPSGTVKITHASRQAADLLCTGLQVDGDPSKKLLFMLSLGLVPNNNDTSNGPCIKLNKIGSFPPMKSSDKFNVDTTPTNLKELVPIQKENIQDTIETAIVNKLRCSSTTQIMSDNNVERNFRSNQDMNKMKFLGVKKLGEKAVNVNGGRYRYYKVANSVVSRVEVRVLSLRSYSRKRCRSTSLVQLDSKFSTQPIPASYKPKPNEIICVDLTNSEGEEELFIGKKFKINQIHRCGG